MEIHGLEDQIILYSNDAIHLPNGCPKTWSTPKSATMGSNERM